MRVWRISRVAVVAAVLAVLAAAGAVYVATSRQGHGHPSTASGQPVRAPVLSELTGNSIPNAAGVRDALRHALTKSGFAASLSGVVIDSTSGAQLFARDATTSVPPASTAKLLTAAAALTTLDREPLETGVARSGDTVYLVGGGDVTVTAKPQPGYPPTATLADLAAKTATALGPTSRVRLRYDAGGWTGPSLAKGWSPSYLSSGNVSALTALELNEARLTGGATAPRATDPARQAADAFRDALVKAGVQVVGSPGPATAPASALGIASVSSPSIPALVQRMLTTSDNDLAEALGRLLARQLGQPATFAGAAAAVLAAVEKLGAPTTGVRLYDASGLSRLDRVTPLALVTLLRIAQRDVRLGPLVEGLPIAGFTGTLADRYRRHPTTVGAGVVRAKTGTLSGVNALAGQVVDADGRLLLFAFVADHVPLPGPAEESLDSLASALAGCGCSG